MTAKQRIGVLIVFLIFFSPLILSECEFTETPVAEKNITSTVTAAPSSSPTEESTKSPTASPIQQPKIDNGNNGTGRIVWINSDSGYRYHRRTCQYVKTSSSSVELSTAQARGYTPCKKCKPGG